MSEKQNFYLERTLLNMDNAQGKASTAITIALKKANDNIDDFIRHTKERASERHIEEDCPKKEDFIDGGQLKRNICGDFGKVKVFVAKGTNAGFSGSVLITENPKIKIALDGKTETAWALRENDFNRETLCISIKRAAVACDE